MIKSNQQVISTYEKETGGADEMPKFDEVLFKELGKVSKTGEQKKKKVSTPVLEKSYTDAIERYRTNAYMTNVADMNVFKI